MIRFLQHSLQNRGKWQSCEVERFVDPDDNHTFSIHWATHFPTDNQTRVIVVIPGILTGHSSRYLTPFVNQFKTIAPTCVVNYPLIADAATGCTVPDYSDSRYLRYFLEFLTLRHPQCQLTLVGFSMGGVLSIKCADLAEKVITVCTPIYGSEVWDSIKGFYYTAMRSMFLLGPMARLAMKQPSKWMSSILAVIRAKDSKQLTAAIEAETNYVIYNMSIEDLIKQLPIGKVTMIHTRDDSIIPYIPDGSPLFARVHRITYGTGDHLLFTPEQIRKVAALL